MSAWTALTARVGAIVAKLETLQPPLLVVRVDGEPVLVSVWPTAEDLEAHARFPGMPRLTLERRLADSLYRLSQLYPHPGHAVELFGQWPGNPPRLELLARARRSSGVGAVPTPARPEAVA
jgi:hypothetical protein